MADKSERSAHIAQYQTNKQTHTKKHHTIAHIFRDSLGNIYFGDCMFFRMTFTNVRYKNAKRITRGGGGERESGWKTGLDKRREERDEGDRSEYSQNAFFPIRFHFFLLQYACQSEQHESRIPFVADRIAKGAHAHAQHTYN